MIMVEQQYIAPGLPQPDGLSGAPSLHDSIPTTETSPYHDLTSYSSVSRTSFWSGREPGKVLSSAVIDLKL
jgi:hypothetical protein